MRGSQSVGLHNGSCTCAGLDAGGPERLATARGGGPRSRATSPPRRWQERCEQEAGHRQAAIPWNSTRRLANSSNFVFARPHASPGRPHCECALTSPLCSIWAELPLSAILPCDLDLLTLRTDLPTPQPDLAKYVLPRPLRTTAIGSSPFVDALYAECPPQALARSTSAAPSPGLAAMCVAIGPRC